MILLKRAVAPGSACLLYNAQIIARMHCLYTNNGCPACLAIAYDKQIGPIVTVVIILQHPRGFPQCATC